MSTTQAECIRNSMALGGNETARKQRDAEIARDLGVVSVNDEVLSELDSKNLKE